MGKFYRWASAWLCAGEEESPPATTRLALNIPYGGIV